MSNMFTENILKKKKKKKNQYMSVHLVQLKEGTTMKQITLNSILNLKRNEIASIRETSKTQFSALL